MPERTYRPDLASLDTGFPRDLAAPPLLREFAAWIADKPRSSLGWFHLASEPLPAAYVRDDHAAERLRERLGCFLQLVDGSHVALWRPLEPGRAPIVVLLGADHQVRAVATRLENFLLDLAHARTGLRDLDRDPSATRAALADWLAARGIEEVSAPCERAGTRFPDWFDAVLIAARSGEPAPQLTAAPLPDRLFERVDPLLGSLADDAQLIAGFAELGIDLGSLRDPAAFRFLARAADGVSFELAWPWDYPSHWLDAKYPKPARRELEQRRARMLWGVTFYLVPERKRAPNADMLEFAAFAGSLPLGLPAGADLTHAEAQLGQPTRGRIGNRIWDDLRPQRTLAIVVNEGPFQRSDLATGTLRELTWRVSQSS